MSLTRKTDLWPIRAAVPADIAPLATLWHQGWHEAHGAIVPAALVSQRTSQLFAKRLAAAGDRLRVAGPLGAPLGLCIIKGDQLDQLYVAPNARGSGLAAALLHEGEDRLRTSGITDALLDCAALNPRAARFYTREGWTSLGVKMIPAEAVEPPMEIAVILFGKQLDRQGAA